MNTEAKINIDDFNYDLPLEKIAQFPLEKRDHSKLLIHKNGKSEKDFFYNIKKYLPQKSLLVFNDTKVIHARLLFKKDTGSTIEIFCLEPFELEQQQAFQQKENCKWKCLVGNNKRWKSGKIKIESNNITLFAEKIKQDGEEFVIEFSWQPVNLFFSEVLEIFGRIPLPPYINRNPDDADNIRYQTMFAKYEGSVAAPTAGLHFTENVLKELEEAGIKTQTLTLHVGAGTFKPVSSKYIADHKMHEEHFCISRQLLESLLNQVKEKNPVIPVGTTSLRTLESIYWLGVKKILKLENCFFLDQWETYEMNNIKISAEESISALIDSMNGSGDSKLNGSTRMIIIPSYGFKIANGIITNFHQPRSTLLLLVAAMIGEKWKEVYQYAMENDFRFLSYGDCCLFI
jgi:S-adenosylmethionine:tRNA ribosyltransferase-isomerase